MLLKNYLVGHFAELLFIVGISLMKPFVKDIVILVRHIIVSKSFTGVKNKIRITLCFYSSTFNIFKNNNNNKLELGLCCNNFTGSQRGRLGPG